MSPVCQYQGRGGEEVVFTCAVGVTLLAAHQSTVMTWRERERRRGRERERCLKVCEAHPYGDWIFSSTCFPAYQFSSLFTHTDTHTCFCLQTICVINLLYVISVLHKIEILSAVRGHCLFRVKHIVIQMIHFPLPIQLCLYHQLLMCHKHSK